MARISGCMRAIVLFAALGACAQPLLANTGWPALYIARGILITSPVALISIAIEAFVLGRTFKWPYRSALWTAFVANLISLGFGAFFTAYVFPMLLLPFASSGNQWLLDVGPSLVWMFVCSVLLEVPAVHAMRKVAMWKLWLPCSIANVLTYGFLAIVWLATKPS
ncbi:MAG: hypothetical protein IT462_00920 [Planctomycetes bacterium]|nr:hypothetical protein [Planctomycetota bacterium]